MAGLFGRLSCLFNALISLRETGMHLAEREGYTCAALALCGLLMLPLVGGCRHMDGAQVDVLERELRQQEDYIYELEDYLIEYSEKLRQARMAQCQTDGAVNESSPTQTKRAVRQGTLDEDLPVTPRLPLNGRNHAAPPAASSPSIVPPTPPATDAAKPETAPALPEATPPAAAPTPTPAPAEKVTPEDMQVPKLEIGPSARLPWRKSGRLARAPKLPPVSVAAPALLIPDPVDYELEAEAPASGNAAKKTADASTLPAAAEEAAEPELAAPKQNAPRLAAEKLHIRRILRQPGEQPDDPGSLLVVVEALNGTDEPADATGTASLMIMAKDAPQSLRRLDRWDFSADETKAAWQSSLLGDGLHLELPLGKSELPKGELELWARLVCPDGRKLLTQLPFDPLKLATIEEVSKDLQLAAEDEGAKPQAADLRQAAADQSAQPDSKTNPESPSAEQQAEKVAAVEKRSAWRASSVKLDPNRVESFATTADGDGWVKRPGETRVASAAGAASSKSAKPAWQRSAAAQTQGGTPQSWSPER